jgi:hypothetical protein
MEAHGMGFISKPIPGMTATWFAQDRYYTPILREQVGYSARPLRSPEQDFAFDSSRFGSTKHERWYDHEYGITRTRCVWFKTHFAGGVKTNAVTAVRILDKDAHDSPKIVPLVEETVVSAICLTDALLHRSRHAGPHPARGLWSLLPHDRGLVPGRWRGVE